MPAGVVTFSRIPGTICVWAALACGDDEWLIIGFSPVIK